MARQVLDELGRASSARHAELARARSQLLAVLGHDLRDPLQAISMSSHLLGRGADTAKMGQRIQNATSRMQRLASPLRRLVLRLIRVYWVQQLAIDRAILAALRTLRRESRSETDQLRKELSDLAGDVRALKEWK